MCVIDAWNFNSRRDEHETVEALEWQIIYADKILINKVDQVSASDVDEIKEAIYEMN